MVLVILLGALLACFKTLVQSLALSDAVCIADRWLGHLSLFMVFGALGRHLLHTAS